MAHSLTLVCVALRCVLLRNSSPARGQGGGGERAQEKTGNESSHAAAVGPIPREPGTFRYRRRKLHRRR
jgi:hypothetical protein